MRTKPRVVAVASGGVRCMHAPCMRMSSGEPQQQQPSLRRASDEARAVSQRVVSCRATSSSGRGAEGGQQQQQQQQTTMRSCRSVEELLEWAEHLANGGLAYDDAAECFVHVYKLLVRSRKQRQREWAGAAWRPSRHLLQPRNREPPLSSQPLAATGVRAPQVGRGSSTSSSSSGSSSWVSSGSDSGGRSGIGGGRSNSGDGGSSTSARNSSSGAGASRGGGSRGGGSGQRAVVVSAPDARDELHALRCLLPLLLRASGGEGAEGGTHVGRYSDDVHVAHTVLALGMAHRAELMVVTPAGGRGAGDGGGDGSSGSSISTSTSSGVVVGTAGGVGGARAGTGAVQQRACGELSYASVCDVADSLCASATPRLLSLSADCVIKLLTGLAYLKLDPGPGWRGLAESALLARVGRMSGGQAAAALHALSLSPAGAKPHPGLVSDLLQRTQSRLHHLRPRPLAALLTDLVCVGFRPRQEWMEQFAQASTPKLSGLSTGDAARVVEAYVQLRSQPPRWWLGRLLATSLHSLHLGSASDAACLLYAVVRLNVPLPPGWLHEGLMAARGVRTWPPPNMAAAMAARRPTSSSSSSVVQQQQQQRQQQAGGGGGASGSDGKASPPGPAAPAAAHSAASPGARVGGSAHAAGRALDVPSTVRVLYVVARQRDDARVAPHVAWARAQLKRLLSEEASAVSTRSPKRTAAREAARAAATDKQQQEQQGQQEQQEQQQQQERQEQQEGGGSGVAVGAGAATSHAQHGAGVPPGRAPGHPAHPQRPLAQLSPQLLLDLLYCVAELGAPAATRGAGSGLRALLSRLQRSTNKLSPSNLATLLVCLAVLKRPPSPSLARAVLSRVTSECRHFSPQELANVLTATGYLGLDPGSDLTSAVSVRLKDFDLVQLAMFVRKLDQAMPRSSGGSGRSSSGQQQEWLVTLQRAARRLFAAQA
ncbi:hypothetical protein FOA52_004250 [Chlamydomonas sp. UWO 241]|nr:hypothetical protein FOA52_004250 [Chlamydomonas sp. UWO 241]